VKKKYTLVILLALGLLALVIAPVIQRAFWSILVLSEFRNFASRGGLQFLTSPPKMQEITYSGRKGSSKADLYLPRSGGKHPGILLNHGVIDTGKDDPRLKRLAEILCRSGFAVCIPDFQSMRSFRIDPSDIEEVQMAFEHFISRKEYILPQSCGLFGFSYGAGPTIIAACRPALRPKVRFVVSFGGYYDLKNVLSFLATGSFEFGGKSYSRQPQEYGKWVFLANNLDLVESPQDRSLLRNILQIKLHDEKAPIERFEPLLGEEGRNILALLFHSDSGQTESLIMKLPASIQTSIKALSVGPALRHLNADLILAHGEDDDMIPFTESIRLAQAAPDPRRVYCQTLKSYSHVDPAHQAWTLKNLITFHLPEGCKLFGLINQLMKYR